MKAKVDTGARTSSLHAFNLVDHGDHVTFQLHPWQESDDDAREALSRVSDLAGQLVGAERWDPELAEQVLQDLEDSGPPQLVRLGDPR